MIRSIVLALVAVVACGGATAQTDTSTTTKPTNTGVATGPVEGGPPLDTSVIPPGAGWNCFTTIGELCFRTAAACGTFRTNVYEAQKSQGAKKEDLDLIGECSSKTSVWCHTIKTPSGVLLWCGDGDEDGKGACLSHVEAMTASSTVSGCAHLN